MIDLSATIEAMKAAGLTDAEIVRSLACLRNDGNVPRDGMGTLGVTPVATQPTTSAMRKRRWRAKRKAEKDAAANRLSLPVPEERPVHVPRDAGGKGVIPLNPKDSEEGKESKNARARGTRLPPEFVPDATCEAAARELKFTKADWKRWFEEFRDYWTGVPGAKGVKLDWQATARNSIRRYAERRPYGKSTHQTDMAAAFDNLERKIGEHSGPRDGAGGPEPPDDSGLSY